MSTPRRYSTSDFGGSRSSYRDPDEHVRYSSSLSGEKSSMLQQEIGEDPIVENCVDHAHDIAAAHGAADVMPEHLLHALTRVSEAAAIMDDMGFNVERLRRDIAAVIAGEIPVARENKVTDLTASAELGDIMHEAARIAERRSSSVMSLSDVVTAMRTLDPTSRVSEMLGKWGSDRSPSLKDQQTALRDDMTNYYSGLRDNSDTELLVQRGLRSIEEAFRKNGAGQSHGADLATMERMMKEQRDVFVREQRDLFNRISAFEAAHTDLLRELREVKGHLTAQDQQFSDVPGSVRNLMRDLHEIRDGLEQRHQQLMALGQQGGGDLKTSAELLQLKTTMDSRDQQLIELQQRLEARVAKIDDAVQNQTREIIEPQRRLVSEINSLREILGTDDTGQNLEVFVSRLSDHSAASQDRFQKLLAQVDEGREDVKRVIYSNNDRLHDIEAMVEEVYSRKQVDVDTSTLDNELKGVRALLTRLVNAQNANTEALSELRLDHSGDLSVISNRLEALTRKVAVLEGRTEGGFSQAGSGTGRYPGGEAGPVNGYTNGNGANGNGTYANGERRYAVDFQQDLDPETAAMDRYTGRTSFAGSGYGVYRRGKGSDVGFLERIDRWLERRFS